MESLQLAQMVAQKAEEAAAAETAAQESSQWPRRLQAGGAAAVGGAAMFFTAGAPRDAAPRAAAPFPHLFAPARASLPIGLRWLGCQGPRLQRSCGQQPGRRRVDPLPLGRVGRGDRGAP